MEDEEYPKIQQTEQDITQIQFPDTSIFQGNLNQNGNGAGMVQFNSGTLFHGELENFQPSSKFAILETGSSILLSSFTPQPTGPSLVTFSDGSAYFGSILNNSADSYGSTYQTTHQTYYAGDFAQSHADGFGCAVQGDFRDSNAIKQVYLGWFQCGEIHGRGLSLAVDGEGLTRFNRFEGYFVNGFRNGSGAIALGSGEWLIGQFINDEKDGTFLYISEQGEIELRFYFKDIMKFSYKSENYYISKPHELKFISMQNEDSSVTMYESYVAYFKYLESTNLPGKSQKSARIAQISILDTIWRYCRKITIPLKVGLITDSRVCTPIISEQIGEIARNLTKLDVCSNSNDRMSQELIDFYKVVESIKSSVIGNFEILRFLFQFYRARDLLTFGEKEKAVYSRVWMEAVEGYIEGEVAKKMAVKEAERVKNEVVKPVMGEMAVLGDNNSANNSFEQREKENITGLSRADLDQTEMDVTVSLDIKRSTRDLTTLMDLEQVEDVEDQMDIKLNKMRQMLQYSSSLPQGESSLDNELIASVIKIIDQNLVVSSQNIKSMIFDMAAFTDQLDLIQPQESYIDLLISQYCKQSDSYQTIIQFDIQTLFSQSIHDCQFTQFICLVLNLYQVFDFDTPISFMNEAVYPYVKSILTTLLKSLETDNFALSILFQPTDPFYIDLMKQKSQSRKRRTDIDDDSISVSQSQISKQPSSMSKQSKFMNSSSKAAVPKILLRDASNQLTEQEQAIFRCTSLSSKLVQLIQINQSYQQKFVFPFLINETIEGLINQRFGLSMSQYLDIDSMTLTFFLFKFFNQFQQIFDFPAISDDIEHYFAVLGPFFVKFVKADAAWFLEENTYISDKSSWFLEKIAPFHVNQQILTAVLTCCLLKSSKINKSEKVKELDNQLDNSTVNSENSTDTGMESIGSFNSFAESGQSTRSQADQKKAEGDKQKMFQVDNKKFDEANCYQVIGEFLQGILEMWSK